MDQNQEQNPMLGQGQGLEDMGIEEVSSDSSFDVISPRSPTASFVSEDDFIPPTYDEPPTFTTLTPVPIPLESRPPDRDDVDSLTIGDLLRGPTNALSTSTEPLALTLTSSPLYARRHPALYEQLCQPIAPPPSSVAFGPNSWLKERWGVVPSPSPIPSPSSIESESPLPSPSPRGKEQKPIFSFEPGALALAGSVPQGRRRSEPVISFAKDYFPEPKAMKPRGGSRKRKAADSTPNWGTTTPTNQLTLDKWISPVMGMGLASIQEQLIEQGLAQLEKENREQRELINELMSVVFKELMTKIECCKILISANAMNAKISMESLKIMFRGLGLQFDDKPIFQNEIVPRPMSTTCYHESSMNAVAVEQVDDQTPNDQEGVHFYVTLPVQNQIHIDPIDPNNCYILDLGQHEHDSAPHTNRFDEPCMKSTDYA